MTLCVIILSATTSLNDYVFAQYVPVSQSVLCMKTQEVQIDFDETLHADLVARRD